MMVFDVTNKKITSLTLGVYKLVAGQKKKKKQEMNGFTRNMVLETNKNGDFTPI